MPGNLCEHCTAMCCRYVALPIETPEERADFDDVRWYLLHENVSVFVEKGEWYIHFATDCRHLLPNHNCGIYQTRPRICRKYDTINCDYHSGEYGWEHHFMSPDHLDEYVRERFSKETVRKERKKSNGKRRLSPGKVMLGRGVRPVPPAKTAPAVADLRGVPLPVLGNER
jgi:uncharacterized protein